MLLCPHNKPVKSFDRDYINWNGKFPCHLSHVMKNHGHDAVDVGSRRVPLDMSSKAWVVGLGNSIEMRIVSKMMISSIFSRMHYASMELTPRLVTKFSASASRIVGIVRTN
jgi:hypothetical protein